MDQKPPLMNSTSPAENPWNNPTLKKIDLGVAYLSFLNLFFGVAGNLVCFLVLATSKDLKRMSYAIYLMYCSLVNTLSLFQWNFNHFLKPFFYFTIEDTSLFSCRLFSFLQYFSLQSGAYILSWMCIDRYVSVIAMPGSLAARLPFSTPKTAHFWSALTMTIVSALNLHILILNGYYDPPEWRNVTVNHTVVATYLYQNPDYHCYSYSPTFSLFPVWEKLHLYFYTIVPFTLMITFNLMLILKSLWRPASSSSKVVIRTTAIKANVEKRRLTCSLLFITMSFLVMTSPGNIAYGYFEDTYNTPQFRIVLHYLDWFSFLFQASFFFQCYLTNKQFKKKCIELWRKQKKTIYSRLFDSKSSNKIHHSQFVITDDSTKQKSRLS